jgi:predicted enzyme related to lactoylglutathione lyase
VKLVGTVLYVDDVPGVMDFYRRAFGFERRHFDEQLSVRI